MPNYDDRLMAVMAPLFIKDGEQFRQFELHLQQARDIGVEAISVDVWWGIVQASRSTSQWDYYDRVFAAIADNGLSIVPIMSLHRCGGGPGDDVNIDLPGWLNDAVLSAGGAPEDLRYQSETGHESSDAIPPWLGEEVSAVYQEMSRFIDGFLKHYWLELRACQFPEINISLGPTGELRYPSYSTADGWAFPHRGYYQCYSESARRSFLRWVRSPQNGCSWASQFGDADIRVPNGHVPRGQGARADSFVKEGMHLQPGYGQDFLNWYHGSLVAHGRRVLETAIATLKAHCTREVQTAPIIGMKLPGVHWQWRCTSVPRYAELTAGLIPPACCFVPDGVSATGYEPLFEMVRDLSARAEWPIRVHFTALEMDDDRAPEWWPNEKEKTSMAHSLVHAVGRTAATTGVPLSGENALANVGAPDSPNDVASWDYVREAFDMGYFSGLTLLRLCRGGWDTDRKALASFIRDYDNGGGATPRKNVLTQSMRVNIAPEQ
jgi:beta-amylase